MKSRSRLGSSSGRGASIGPGLQFLKTLWALDHVLQQCSKAMAAQLGLTGPQRFVLRFVQQHPGASAGEIAELLHLHPSTLTGILRRVEQRGLLRRDVDAQDGRRARLYITPRGAKIVARTRGTVEAGVQRVLASCSPAEIAAARRVLLQLTAQLERTE